MIKNDENYLIRRTYTNYGGVNMAFDLNDIELQATREMNKTAWESEIDKWSKEYLIERYKDLAKIEKEHKKENGELREKLKELEKKLFDKTYKFLCDHPYIDTFDTREVIMLEQVQKDYIPKLKLTEVLGIEEDMSEEKILDYIDILVSENNRLEDIEDRKVQIEYQNVFNKGVKSIEDKIKNKIKEKIKEKENLPNEIDFKAFYRLTDLKNIEIQVLQELLEERN